MDAPAIARFQRFVEELPNGCHRWTGAKDTAGYGVFRLEGALVRAHHVGFFLRTGRWITGIGRHTCDHRWCVNGGHVMDGTAQDNANDRIERGRFRRRPRRGLARLRDRRQKCALTTEQATAAKAMVASGVSQAAAAAHFGVSASTISRAVNGLLVTKDQ